MQHVVRPGDTLWGIAGTHFGAPEKWTAIARDNHLSRPTRLMVGERLILRDELVARRPANAPATGAPPKPSSEPQHAPSVISSPAPFHPLPPTPSARRGFRAARSGSTSIRQRQRARRLTTPMKSSPTSTVSPARCRSPATSRIKELERLVRGDREVLIRGSVPATAIKGTTAMALTRGLQVVQVVGFVVTAVELTQATRKSMAARSAAPIAAEGIRQVGGWAMAWGGMKLGGVAGAAVGIETGPGAIVFGAAGALAGGFAGYMGFDWVADQIDSN